ncbi:MAG: DEAD/DEAH box helicase [Rhodobacteraceae bacterium]|nr:DEAD/DEAH box helicase [Paracoccaceae bacterium]
MIAPLAEALAMRGYDVLTPVQLAVTQPDLASADLLVSAQTGSGKTVGFGMAIAPTILDGKDGFGPAGAPLALIIAPTRELAMQVKRELGWLYERTGASVASCVGGMDMREERRALDRGAHLVVGTPGRLRDHIMRGSLDMSAMRAIVLDEADEMLDLGFREDLEFILGGAPQNRRTLMFSATMPKAIATLAQEFQKDARRITMAGARSQHADIEYRALHVAARDAENAIVNVLRFYEARNAIVFCNTRMAVNRLTTRLSNRSFSVVALSGELSQTERTHALQAMRDGRARVCVATDVAARGIDLPNLELVIHAELPTNSDTLLHRSGRTGRAGRKGVSVLVIPRNARKKAERLLHLAKLTAEWADAPSAEAVLRRDEERLLADPIWNEPASDEEAAFAARLLKLHGAERIAAAYLRAYRDRHSAPEELAATGAPGTGPRGAGSFGPSRWFALSLGRKHRAEPRWILPMLCRAGNIGRDDVGAIRLQETETFVEILATRTTAITAAIGAGGRLEGDVTIRALSEPPFGGRAEGTGATPGPQGCPPRSKPARLKKKQSDTTESDLVLHGLRDAVPATETARNPSRKAQGKKQRKGVAAAAPARARPSQKPKVKPGKPPAHRKGRMMAPKKPRT